MVLVTLDSDKQKKEVDHYLTPYTKINSKWIKDLKVRCGTIKHLEENIDSTLFDIGLSSIFFNTMSTQARETTETINKWDYLGLKSSCKAKETVNEMKDNPTPGRKYLKIIHPTMSILYLQSTSNDQCLLLLIVLS